MIVADSHRYLTADDWPRVADFVHQGRKPNLTRQLLSSAEYLADAGHDRAGLTEAVSALEVALGSFARATRFSAIRTERLRETATGESLVKLVQHLGLRASITVLLPLLLTEEQAPMHLLQRCAAAIDERNNVVHNGQREVDSELLGSFCDAIRSLCETLLQFTSE
jgi:hypothetical protein